MHYIYLENTAFVISARIAGKSILSSPFIKQNSFVAKALGSSNELAQWPQLFDTVPSPCVPELHDCFADEGLIDVACITGKSSSSFWSSWTAWTVDAAASVACDTSSSYII